MNGYDSWEKNLLDQDMRLEVVTEVLYDTQVYERNKTKALHFFQHPSVDASRSNMMCPAMLPQPWSFLISEISLTGVLPVLADGNFYLTIGNKLYARFPLRWFVVNARGSVILHEKLFIAPLVNFRASVDFARIPKIYGPDIDVVVSFTGAMARPVA